MIGTTMKKKVWWAPRPSSVPTAGATGPAATVPAASGAELLRQPLTSTLPPVGRQRHEDLQEALDQDLPVHAQDAADDDRRDEQVEEVRDLREVGRDLHDRLGQHLVVNQRRGDEGGADRRPADVAQDRQPLADLG